MVSLYTRLGRRILIACATGALLLISAPAACAGTNAPSATANAETSGRDLLQEINERREAICQLHMPFRHERDSELFKTPLTREGTFYYAKDRGLVLHYEKPDNYAAVMGRRAASLVRRGERPQTIMIDRDPLLAGMTRVLQQDLVTVDRLFEVAVSNNPSGRVDVQLTPTRRNRVQVLELSIDRTNGVLRRLRIREASGDVQTIEFGDPVFEAFDDALLSETYWEATPTP